MGVKVTGKIDDGGCIVDDQFIELEVDEGKYVEVCNCNRSGFGDDGCHFRRSDDVNKFYRGLS